MIQSLSDSEGNHVSNRKPPRRAPNEVTADAKRSRPVQLTIFDYAARVGIVLLPDAS